MGTNLGDRWANLRFGVAGLEAVGLELGELSSVWECEPVDSPDPTWFLNMAAEVRSNREPLDLLEALLDIERRAGRVRSVPNAPRTLDLDLLLLGQLEYQGSRLCLPHPRMWQRRFVLEPLAEIAPDLLNPATGRTVVEELQCLGDGAAANKVGRLATSSRLHV